MAYAAWIKGCYLTEPNQGILSIPVLKGWQNSLTLFGINFILIAGCTVIMIALNKGFSFLGGITSLFASLFILFETTVPILSARWNEGSVVALVTLICMFILFSIYEDRKSTSRIFLIFTILSSFTLWQVAFLYLIPLFIVGVIQVRVFSFKALLAILFGIITPYWITIGTGLVNIADIQLPTLIPIYTLNEIPQYFLSAAVIAFMGVVAVVANFFTLMKYRLQVRVYNGFILLLFLFTLGMMLFDANNAPAYFTLLTLNVGMQIAHWFATNSYKRQYIAVIFVTIVMLANYVWFWLPPM